MYSGVHLPGYIGEHIQEGLYTYHGTREAYMGGILLLGGLSGRHIKEV